MKDISNISNTVMIDLIAIIISGLCVFFIATHFDIIETIFSFLQSHEDLELDELITLALYLVLALAVFSMRRWKEQYMLIAQLSEQNSQLNEALAEVKQLKKFIPICSMCKQIRDDNGCWHQLEAYLSKHTDASFSHGICPSCMERYYAEYSEDISTSQAKN